METPPLPAAPMHARGSSAPAIVRAVICGAVDDGKSTLLGRLLLETESVPLDEIEAATRAGELDVSLLTDGLSSERQQGITIDVAYRAVSLPDGRRVIIADSPGHEQYTRNMAVAAALADIAVLVIDVERGIRAQSYRHAAICARMGVKHLVVALNKVDHLVDAPTRLAALQAQAETRFETHGFESIVWIPTSGLTGDGIVRPRPEGGPTIADALRALPDAPRSTGPTALRLPVQTITRHDDQRWYGGRLALGDIAPGDEVRVARTGTVTTVVDIVRAGSSTPRPPGAAVAVRLRDEIDVMRGDLLVTADDPVQPHRVWAADLVWLDTEPLDPSRSYLLRCGPVQTPVRVDRVRSVLAIESGDEQGGRALAMNDLGRVELVCDRAIALDPYAISRDTGGLVLVDRATARTVAAGMVVSAIERESEVVRHASAIDRPHRERLNGVRGVVVWLTGLPGSGKSTIADAVEKSLFDRGVRSVTLDGDTVRSTLSEDLGFSPEDRRENVRRVARVAELMLDAGLVVLVSLVSPFRDDRTMARERFADDDFLEVFVDTPLEVCEERDPKGLYARARATGGGQMTGLGQQYEEPEHPELRLDGTQPLERSVSLILERILSRRPL